MNGTMLPLLSVVVRCVASVAVLLGMGHAGANAQTILGEPPGARIVALGYTGVADDSDPSSVFMNPANVSFVDRLYLSGDYQELFSGISTDIGVRGVTVSGGYGFDHGSGSIGLGAQVRYSHLSFGESIEINPEGAALGTYESTESMVAMALGVGVRTRAGPFLGVGGALKRVGVDYGPGDFILQSSGGEGDAWTSDVGARAGVRSRQDRPWRLEGAAGISLMNVGGALELPGRRLKLQKTTGVGASVAVDGPLRPLADEEVPIASFLLNVDFYHPETGDDFVGVGFEAAAMQIIHARLGYVNSQGSTNSVLNLGIGAGMTTARFMVRLDYGLVPFEVFGTSADYDSDNKFSLTIGLL